MKVSALQKQAGLMRERLFKINLTPYDMAMPMGLTRSFPRRLETAPQTPAAFWRLCEPSTPPCYDSVKLTSARS